MRQKKPKTVRAIHANRGIEAEYRRALKKAIRDMQQSVLYWIGAQYKKAPPRMAMDSAADDMNKRFMRLAKQWQRKFDEWAPIIAERYVTRLYKATDSAFNKALKDAGWAIEFKLTPAMRDALDASIAENVSLIRNVPQKFLTDAQGIVMRAYTEGTGLDEMLRELKARHPMTDKRAALIARDQSNKINAVTTRARQKELGITEAIWRHSGGGKEPRPDHVAADGKTYKIDKGCYISGEYIFPGEKINCRCVARSVLPF